MIRLNFLPSFIRLTEHKKIKDVQHVQMPLSVENEKQCRCGKKIRVIERVVTVHFGQNETHWVVRWGMCRNAMQGCSLRYFDVLSASPDEIVVEEQG